MQLEAEEEMRSCLQALRAAVPCLTHSSHKGVSGRVGVIGGSLEYTGAPYFAAISAMKTGADLVHVFCPEDAAPVLKSYSPELIVHPLLSKQLPEAEVLESIGSWFPRLHSLVVGPGLGRDPVILECVKKILAMAKEMQKSLVIDADGLFLISQEPDIISGYTKAVLTPNGGEFPRLFEKVFGKKCQGSSIEESEEETKRLAAEMGGVTILRKGAVDIISNGAKVIRCTETGCPRRCGGQGDVLSGIAGLFSYWMAQKETQLLSEFGIPPVMVAAYGACFLTKKCAQVAFSKRQRSMLSHDLVDQIGPTFNQHLEKNH